MSEAVQTPYRFTVDEVRGMVAAGLLREPERLELIEGELLEMPSDGPLHRDYSYALGRWLFKALSAEYVIMPGTTLELSDISAPKPDWYVFAADMPTAKVRGPDVLLAIEQADSSLAFDLGRKARLYAAHGVREYWVIDLHDTRTHVFREPSQDGYGFMHRVPADEPITAGHIPHLTLRLDALARVGTRDRDI